MRITGIEPTPSPNTMKLTLDENLPGGKSGNYTKDNKTDAPHQIQQLFTIAGIKGVYHVADFIALEREPKANWEQVLAETRKVFGEDNAENVKGVAENDHFGEVRMQVQTFKSIPMQIKLLTSEEEKRIGLPARFSEAAFAAAGDHENIVFERKWEERSARYGNDLDAIGNEVAEEIAAAYSQERLDQLVQWSDPNHPAGRPEPLKVTKEMMDDPDWQNRYAVLDQMDPVEDDLPVLNIALDDKKQSVRRLATTLIGMIETKATLPYLYKALKDKSVTVRRTAGDALSDLGDPEAIDEMINSLQDKSKIVRWRAAMFLYEVGDERAIEPLKKAVGDSEFEVDMQIQIALERIEGGEEAQGSIWKQMTESVRADREKKGKQ